MLFEYIKNGNRMEIHHRFDRRLPKAYASQVQEILPNNQLIAYAPMEYGSMVRLPNGDDCSLVFFTEKGIYKFGAKIIKNVSSDGVYYVVLRVMGDGEKIQRRDFFRYECLLDFVFAEIDENIANQIRSANAAKEAAESSEETDSAESEVHHLKAEFNMYGVVKDIGGGGIRFVSNDDVEENTDVCCRIQFGDDVILPVGTILHKQTYPKSVYAYQYRIQFNDIRPEDQERIVQFIFEEQRKKLKRK